MQRVEDGAQGDCIASYSRRIASALSNESPGSSEADDATPECIATRLTVLTRRSVSPRPPPPACALAKHSTMASTPFRRRARCRPPSSAAAAE